MENIDVCGLQFVEDPDEWEFSSKKLKEKLEIELSNPLYAQDTPRQGFEDKVVSVLPPLNNLTSIKDRFATYPDTFPRNLDLAKSGLFYVSEETVKCVYCKIVLSGFSGDDDPYFAHAQLSPNCVYLKYYFDCLTMTKYNPMFAAKEDRLKTYNNWPNYFSQKAEDLAEAGFYYTGVRDRVKCFYCDLGLNEWDPEDDPWTEHARWGNECLFVLMKKSVLFINKVTHFKTTNYYHLNMDSDALLICRICVKRSRNICFRNCNHVVCCSTCANKLVNCPICRQYIQQRITLFFA